MEHIPGGLRSNRRGSMRTKPLRVSAQAVHNSKGLAGLAGTGSARVKTSSEQSIRRAPSPRPAARPSDAQLVETGTAQPADVREGPSKA